MRVGRELFRDRRARLVDACAQKGDDDAPPSVKSADMPDMWCVDNFRKPLSMQSSQPNRTTSANSFATKARDDIVYWIIINPNDDLLTFPSNPMCVIPNTQGG